MFITRRKYHNKNQETLNFQLCWMLHKSDYRKGKIGKWKSNPTSLQGNWSHLTIIGKTSWTNWDCLNWRYKYLN